MRQPGCCLVGRSFKVHFKASRKPCFRHPLAGTSRGHYGELLRTQADTKGPHPPIGDCAAIERSVPINRKRLSVGSAATGFETCSHGPPRWTNAPRVGVVACPDPRHWAHPTHAGTDPAITPARATPGCPCHPRRVVVYWPPHIAATPSPGVGCGDARGQG
jgi:hypothetical protein